MSEIVVTYYQLESVFCPMYQVPWVTLKKRDYIDIVLLLLPFMKRI